MARENTCLTARKQLELTAKQACVCRDGDATGYLEPVLDEIAYQTTESPAPSTTTEPTTTTKSPESKLRHEELVNENLGTTSLGNKSMRSSEINVHINFLMHSTNHNRGRRHVCIETNRTGTRESFRRNSNIQVRESEPS